ncbi:major facilitator superfamily transporter [Moniliophthora roreri]|nr:major facilitator superfamily transporter [Moniliophthora roreri]
MLRILPNPMQNTMIPQRNIRTARVFPTDTRCIM